MCDSCIFSQTGVIEISHLMTEVLDELCWCTANRRGWWVTEAVFLLAGNCSCSSQRINIWINHRGINLLLCSPEECLLKENVLYLPFFFFCFRVDVHVRWRPQQGHPAKSCPDWSTQPRIPRTPLKRCASVKTGERWKRASNARVRTCMCESPR